MLGLNFNYECKHIGNLMYFQVTGFSTFSNLVPVKDSIVTEIETMDKKGQPFKILFDLRGLKALDPRAVEALHELDKVVYECVNVIKVGTVLDSIIAKMQQKRVAHAYPMPNAKIFDDYNECLAWLNKAG